MILKVFVFLSLILNTLLAEIITVGYNANAIADYSKKDLTISSDVWLREIAQELDLEIRTLIYDDPKILMRDLQENKVDYVTGFGLTFVKYFDLSILDDGFSQGFLDGGKEVFVILVKKNSGIKKIKDLKERVIGMQENDEAMRLYLELSMSEKRYSPLNVVLFSKRQRVLHKLFFGKIDAAVVTNNSFKLANELNPQIGKQLEVLVETDLQASGFGFLRKSLHENTKQKIIEVAKNMHNTPRGKQLLTLYKTEVIVDSNLKDLQPYSDLYKDALKLKSKENR